MALVFATALPAIASSTAQARCHRFLLRFLERLVAYLRLAVFSQRVRAFFALSFLQAFSAIASLWVMRSGL